MTLTLTQRINELVAEHGSLGKAARHIGVDLGYLCHLRAGTKGAPGDDTLARLGLTKQVTYTRATPTPPAPRPQRDGWTISPRSRAALRDVSNALTGRAAN